MNYVNKSITFITDSIITEYDIKSANTSLMEYYNLVDKSIIDKISNMNGDERKRAVGLMYRRSKEFGRSLERAFDNIVNDFIKINELDKDNDIISIHRDAVFILNKHPSHTLFDNVVNFRIKGRYTGYMKINKFEIYYSPETIDIKGISDDLLPFHDDGMVEFFRDIFKYSYDKKELHSYLKEFLIAYKERELPLNMYREFNLESSFHFQEHGGEYRLMDIDEEDVNHVNISYNYINIILPVLQLFV